MIQFTNGEIFILEAKNETSVNQTIAEFYQNGHEDDIICVQYEDGKKQYINALDMKNNSVDMNCHVIISDHVFQDIYVNPHMMGGVPVLDRGGVSGCYRKMLSDALYASVCVG